MYTPEEEELLRESYPATAVSDLAKALNKSERSIIGKLSRMGIYQKKEYVGKTGERPITKLELCARIAQILEIEVDGLEKAPKEVLKRLLQKLAH